MVRTCASYSEPSLCNRFWRFTGWREDKEMEEWNSSMCPLHLAICLQAMCTLSQALSWNNRPLNHLQGALRVQTRRDKRARLNDHRICQPGTSKTRPSGWGLFYPLYKAPNRSAKKVPTCSTQQREEITAEKQTFVGKCVRYTQQTYNLHREVTLQSPEESTLFPQHENRDAIKMGETECLQYDLSKDRRLASVAPDQQNV